MNQLLKGRKNGIRQSTVVILLFAFFISVVLPYSSGLYEHERYESATNISAKADRIKPATGLQISPVEFNEVKPPETARGPFFSLRKAMEGANADWAMVRAASSKRVVFYRAEVTAPYSYPTKVIALRKLII